MADEVFYQVTQQASVGLDAVDNVFWYKCNPLLPGPPTLAQQNLVAARFAAYMTPFIFGVSISAYVAAKLTVRAFNPDGTPSDLLPFDYPISGSGELTGARDGNVHSAILRAALGGKHSLVTGSANLSNAYWSLGPQRSSDIGDDNAFIPTASAAWIALMAAVPQGLADGAGIFFAFPIKVSHTAGHVVTPNVTAWRDVLAATLRPQAGFRKSRVNGR